MKSIIYILTSIILVSYVCNSCALEEGDGDDAIAVSTFYPTLVMEGTEVLITGSGLGGVRSVIFPGGVPASSLSVLDDSRLKVIVPAGVSVEAGPLIVRGEESEFSSRQVVRRAVPRLNYFNPSEVVQTYANLYISGVDFLLIDALRFVGSSELEIAALDFVRKSNTQINVALPPETPVGEGIRIAAIFKNGDIMELGYLKIERGQRPGGHWEEQEFPLYSGEAVSVGSWGEWLTISALPFSNATMEDIIRVYISDIGENPQGGLRDGSWSDLSEGTNYFGIEVGDFYEYTITDESVLTKLKEGGVIIGGNAYTITGVVLVSLVWVEGGDAEESLTDPITSSTIMLNDFEDDGSHNASWDGSWTDAEATEVAVDGLTGNVFIRLVKDLKGWIINCNHKDFGTIVGIENYVIKLDVLVPEDVIVPSAQSAQWVLGDSWVWVGDGLIPESTGGKWVTIRFDASSLDLSGDLVIGTSTNGLFTDGAIPVGVCIDNFRLDPKE